MKRIVLFIALLASLCALSACGAANSVAGTGTRMFQSVGRLVGL